MYNNQLSVLRTELRSCKRKAGEQSKQLAEQQNMLAEHQKQTLEYANRLDENDKKNEEMARKFSTLLQVNRRQQQQPKEYFQILMSVSSSLLQELNKCKTELQFWRSKSPAIPSVCSSCNQKIAPVLPEDLQALLNQGVDPENIIISDDGDANIAVDADEEDVDVDGTIVNGGVDVGNAMVDKQFASPDDSTTAKLLAVNSAAKNLKRKYSAANCEAECAATSNAIASNVTPFNVNITTRPTTPTATSNSSNCNSGGYSTKLFYGNNNHQQRSGVIVSPVSMKLSIGSNGSAIGNRLTMSGGAVEELPRLAVLPVGATDIADQVESKKARRVQKANRCVNSAHGKRSK